MWPVQGWYIDTLLGPERTRECFFLGKKTIRSGLLSYRFRASLVRGSGCRCGVRVRVGVLFENCTVDASIFVL